MSKHFEMTVLGGSLSALAAAALLARHGFRVLVVGMRHRDATYTFENVPLSRRLATLDYASSPLFRRVLEELGQVQAFQRRVEIAEPSFQIVGAGLRVDVPRDATARAERLAATFEDGGVVRAIDTLGREVKGATNELFAQPFLYPGEGILKKAAAEKRIRALPHAATPLESSPFGSLPETHPFARALAVLERIAEPIEARPRTAFTSARVAGVYGTDLARETDADGIARFLSERIVSDGGEVRLRDRVDRIEHDGTKVTAIQLAGEPKKMHTDWIVAANDTDELVDLLLRGGTFRAPELPKRARLTRRYLLSVVLRGEGVPPLLADRAVFLGPSRALDFFVERTRLTTERERLLLAHDIEESAVPRARETLLEILEAHLPYVERHYEYVDSPHDGRPLFRYEGGKRRDVDRTLLKQGGATVEREPMDTRVSLDTPFPFEGDPPRPFHKNVLLASESVVPGFGREGALLAALAAVAYLVERDPQKGRLRRKNWTKIEIG